MADVLKAEGNKAFAAKNFDEAVYVLFTQEYVIGADELQ